MEFLVFAAIILATVWSGRQISLRLFSSRRIVVAVVALCVVVLLSCAQNPAHTHSLMESLGFLCGPAWLLLMMRSKINEAEIAWMFRAISVAAAIVAMIVLLQWNGRDPLVFGGAQVEWNAMVPRMRLYSTFGNPNLAASYLVAAAFAVFALAASAATRAAKIVFYIAGILIVAAVIGCGSRGEWFAAAAGAVLSVILFSVRRRNSRSMESRGAFAGVAPFFLPASFLIPNFFSAAFKRFGGRVYMWRVAWPLFAKHPLVGSGWGSVSLRFLDLQAKFLGRHPELAWHWSNPAQLHNDPLQFLAETGVIGFVAAAILLALYAVRVRRNLFRGKSGQANFTIASAGGVTAILAGSVFNFQMANAPVLILFFTFIAIPFLVHADENKSEARESAIAQKPAGSFRVVRAMASFTVLLIAVFLLWKVVNNARADLKYAAAVRVEDSDPSDAARLYGEAAGLAPWNGLIHFGFARALYVQDRDAEALSEAMVATKTYSDSHLEVLIARILEDMQRDSEAQEHYRRARYLDPGLPLEL